jgi:hypothetical protein
MTHYCIKAIRVSARFIGTGIEKKINVYKIETAEMKVLISDKNVPDQTKLTTRKEIRIQI